MNLNDTMQSKPPTARQVASAYKSASARYAAVGVDTEAAIATALATPISVHCWQADDVAGLEVHDGATDSGGLQATGDYPGAARTGDEIRADFEVAAGLIPGELRFNLHAMYAETGSQSVERDELAPEHFATWIDWASANGWGLDFNPSLFGHPMAADGLTLSHPKKSVRDFWVRHCIASREVARAMASKLGDCACNIWIADGFKDATVDRAGPRNRLIKSLDAVLDRKMRGVIDTVESKLFGIGMEDYTVGSHEFYLGYAISRGTGLCMDMGHYHPTETIADKISAVAPFVSKVLMHLSRGVRWDSDHVTLYNDDLRAVCDAGVRSGAMGKLLWATDFFDASINRVAAWTIGVRAVRKALLGAMLEPWDAGAQAQNSGDGTSKLALRELRTELPFGAVWEQACAVADTPLSPGWLQAIRSYEADVLSQR